MTVKELIEALSQFAPDASCEVIDSGEEHEPLRFPVLCCTEYDPGVITIEY